MKKNTIQILYYAHIASCCLEELPGTTIDSEPTFHEHIPSFCSEANLNFSGLARESKYMGKEKRLLLLTSYISSKSNYCPLIYVMSQ